MFKFNFRRKETDMEQVFAELKAKVDEVEQKVGLVKNLDLSQLESVVQEFVALVSKLDSVLSDVKAQVSGAQAPTAGE